MFHIFLHELRAFLHEITFEIKKNFHNLFLRLTVEYDTSF